MAKDMFDKSHREILPQPPERLQEGNAPFPNKENVWTPEAADTRQLYNKLIGGKAEDQFVPAILAYPARPSAKDYEKGFFHRYFICRITENTATEVSKEFWQQKRNKLPHGLYINTSFKWIISNSYRYNVGKVLKGINAFNINEKTVLLKSEDMPQLKNTIEDFAKFVR